MNVKELRELLEQYDPETEVRFLSQPKWPFVYSIASVQSTKESIESNFDDLQAAHLSRVEDHFGADSEEYKAALNVPVAVIEGANFDEATNDDRTKGVNITSDGIVYLVEGQQIRYANRIEAYMFDVGGF